MRIIHERNTIQRKNSFNSSLFSNFISIDIGKSDCNHFTDCIAESRYYFEYEEQMMMMMMMRSLIGMKDIDINSKDGKPNFKILIANS